MKYDSIFTWQLALGLLLLLSFSQHNYVYSRYGGRILLHDSVTLMRGTDMMEYEKAIIHDGLLIYPNGFGFQVYSIILKNLFNIDYTYLFNYFYNIQGIFLVPIYFVFIREFVNDDKIAVFGTLLLNVQPDFFFVTFRATHERFFIMAFMLFVLSLKRSFYIACQTEMKKMIILAYIFITTMLAMNIFIANSVFTTVFFSMILGLTSYSFRVFKKSFLRLIYVSMICLILSFYFIFFLYSPAKVYLKNIKTLLHKSELLLFGMEQKKSFTETFPQYQYVTNQYKDPWIFMVLRLFDWIIIPISFIAVIFLTRDFVRHSLRDTHLEHLVLLLFLYYGFILQFAFSIFFDRIGVLGRNTELRLFPYVHIVSIPFFSLFFFARYKALSPSKRKFLFLMISVFILVSCVFAMLKTSNDTRVTYKRYFYSEAEQMAVHHSLSKPHGIWPVSRLSYILRGQVRANNTDLLLPRSFNKVMIMTSDEDAISMHYAGINATYFYYSHWRVHDADRIYDSDEAALHIVFFKYWQYNDLRRF
ncbi:hypothetical protein ACFLRF_02225 [Candidatus Altiarchaeota archaeon]